MNIAQKKFRNTRELYENELNTYDSWENAEVSAVRLQKQYPEYTLIDIMIPSWRDWLFFHNTNKPNPKYLLFHEIFHEHILTIAKALRHTNKYKTIEDVENNLATIIDSAIHLKALKQDFFNQNNEKADAKTDQKFKETIKHKYNITGIELNCGNMLLEISTYLDFMFRHNAYDEDSPEILIHPMVLHGLSIRFSKINDEIKKLAASIKQAKSRTTIKKQQNIAYKIWRENNLGRDDESVAELKRLYEQQTGTKLRQSIRTIKEIWMSQWNKNSKLAS